MEQGSEVVTRIDHLGKCQELLEALCAQGGSQLIPSAHDAQPLPVLLMDVLPGERLILDLTSAPGALLQFEAEESFALGGLAGGSLMRTEPLRLLERLETPGRTQVACAWPQWLEVIHRRSAFRAELNARMHVRVDAQPEGSDKLLTGRLLNLSLGGCLIELQVAGVAELHSDQLFEQLTLEFPSGLRMVLSAYICHAQITADWQVVRYGCAFKDVGADLERRLWFAVREIERERARTSVGGDSELSPSPLFVRPEQRAPQAGQRQHGLDYATPMARRLARVSGYLNGQLLQLQQGAEVDATLLSRHSEFLLGLLSEDREALLFACHCLVDDSPLVQHCVAVAVRLADLTSSRGLPGDLVKAIVACALVHDLGKALLPSALMRSEGLGAEQRQQFASHVGLIRERLRSCKWLAEPVIKGVVEGINERLDGSGYPLGLSGDELGELARAAAVVDVIDAMSRGRPDRPGHTASGIYRCLIGREVQLDSQWVQRYIRHFGVIPIGALVRFADGALGWVQRLDRNGGIAQVQLTDQPSLKGATLSEPLSGTELVRLGKIDGILVPTPVSV